MTAVAVAAKPRIWLAGNPGPPPSAGSVVFLLTALALALAVSAAVAWSRRHYEKPLRKEMQARPVVTFRASVNAKAAVLGMMTSQHGPLHLTVRGDMFEVSHGFPLARFLFGQDYRYRAEDTTIEVVPGLWHDWIEISGKPGMRGARIQVGHRKMSRQIWDALAGSGAHPLGPAPPL